MTIRQRRLIPVAIFLVALLIGLLQGGRFSLWDDEGFSVASAHLHLTNLIGFTRDRDPHTGFWHLLLHYWIALNGDGEAWVRSLSAIFTAGGAVFLWLFARRLFGEAVAIAGTALFVLNGSVEAFAQEARPYGMAEFFTAAGMYLLVRAVESQRTKTWAGWAVVTTLAIYSHPFTALVLIGAYISLLFAPKRPSWRQLAMTVVIQGVLCVPLALMLATQSVSHINWIPPLNLEHLGGALLQITGHGGVGMIALIGLLVLTLLIKTLASMKRHEDAWPQALVLLWALLLPTGLIFLDLFKHVLDERYLMPCLPGMMLASVVAIKSFGLREYRWGAGVLTVVFALVSVNTYFTHGQKDDWRTAALYVQHNAQPGDAIIVSNDQFNVFKYYYAKDGASVGTAPNPISPARDWHSNVEVHEPFINMSSPVNVVRAVAPYTRVWYLHLDAETTESNLQTGLKSVYNTEHTKQFDPRVDATLYYNATSSSSLN